MQSRITRGRGESSSPLPSSSSQEVRQSKRSSLRQSCSSTEASEHSVKSTFGIEDDEIRDEGRPLPSSSSFIGSQRHDPALTGEEIISSCGDSRGDLEWFDSGPIGRKVPRLSSSTSAVSQRVLSVSILKGEEIEPCSGYGDSGLCTSCQRIDELQLLIEQYMERRNCLLDLAEYSEGTLSPSETALDFGPGGDWENYHD